MDSLFHQCKHHLIPISIIDGQSSHVLIVHYDIDVLLFYIHILVPSILLSILLLLLVSILSIHFLLFLSFVLLDPLFIIDLLVSSISIPIAIHNSITNWLNNLLEIMVSINTFLLFLKLSHHQYHLISNNPSNHTLYNLFILNIN